MVIWGRINEPEPEPEREVHSVEGWLHETEPADLYHFLTRNPPTAEQIGHLIAEEMLGHNRKTIHVILEYFGERAA